MLRLRRPSPAMGVASIALFVALSGVGVAATNDFLPKNSVGTSQIQNNSVTRAKIAHQTITSVLIKPGSLMASDFATGQIPAGPKGDTGAAGPAGPAGATGVQGPAGSLGTLTVHSSTVYIASHTYGSVERVAGSASRQAITVSTSWELGSTMTGSISVWPILGSSDQPIGYAAGAYNADTVGHWLTIHVAFG